MLHILLLILKIVGIIIAFILGILLLLLCGLLFVPIRYEMSGRCDGTIESLKSKTKVTWFLHFARADVLSKGKKIKWQIRIAWLKKSNQVRSKEMPVVENNNQEEGVHDESKESKSVEEIHEMEKTDIEIENTAEKREDHLEEDVTASEREEKKSFIQKIKKKIDNVKLSIQNIIEKVKGLLKKKEKIEGFLKDESHINAFHKAKKELFVLLKKLKPKKVNIKLRFGFDDPSVTGQALGGLAVLYPFLGDTTEIVPDFENKILEGTVYVKGKIRLCHFVSLALRLILNKDIRSTYKDIRNFKL